MNNWTIIISISHCPYCRLCIALHSFEKRIKACAGRGRNGRVLGMMCFYIRERVNETSEALRKGAAEYPQYTAISSVSKTMERSVPVD